MVLAHLIVDDVDVEVEAHLGDCRSYGGFSGSPCFLELSMPGLTPTEPPVPTPPEAGPVGRNIYLHLLCGIVTWHLEPPVDREESSIFGVVCILTSDAIWRALMSDGLVRKRRELDGDGDEPEARPTNVSTNRPGDEFERFEDLTRKLAQVPKAEVDEKRKA
jgi:hypothetical protein